MLPKPNSSAAFIAELDKFVRYAPVIKLDFYSFYLVGACQAGRALHLRRKGDSDAWQQSKAASCHNVLTT